MKLTILSPQRRLVEEVPVDEVTLTGSEGQIQVLEGHAPMIGTLEAGVFAYRQGGAEHSGVISSGFFEVTGGNVVVTAESLELKGEIKLEDARRAQKEAEDVLRDAQLDEHRFKEYQAQLELALVRQHLADKQ